MKALVFRAPGRLELCETAAPQCPGDGLLIRVEACGVCESDVKLWRHGHDFVTPPRIPGHEVVGTVVEVGNGVHGHYDSERVAVAAIVPCGICQYCANGRPALCDHQIIFGRNQDGGMAEFMAVPRGAVQMGCVTKLPDGLDLTTAALAQPLAGCIQAQDACGTGLGRTVLVLGAGPIGCLSILLARARGAVNLILADDNAGRLRRAKAVCPEALLVNVGTADLAAEVMGLTERHGADVVLVTRTDRKLVESAFALVARGGVIDFLHSLPKDDAVISLDVNLLRAGQFSVIGSRGAPPRYQALALQLLASGRVPGGKLISHTFTLDEAVKALEVTESGAAMKAVIAR